MSYTHKEDQAMAGCREGDTIHASADSLLPTVLQFTKPLSDQMMRKNNKITLEETFALKGRS